ncbi:hypothetical protein [Bdellovibrio sp. HCB274]|uniref:hypothetical protein n=1 Tax=Bdellovibrio sp. HCB274 TaxID=3394361 RepID=UPI0039B3B3B7
MLTRRASMVLISATILVFQSLSFAEEPESFPSNVSYVNEPGRVYGDYPSAIDKAFEHIAFSTLKGNGNNNAKNSLDIMNRIYTPKYGEAFVDKRIAFAKSGIDLKGPAVLNQIYHAGKGYLVHVKSPGSGIVALYFEGFQPERIASIRDKIVSSLRNEKGFALHATPLMNKLNFFQTVALNMAFAETPDVCGGYFGSTPGKSLSNASFEKLWNCTKGFAGGVWDSTGGSVASVAKGVYNVVVHPIDTFNKASEEFDKLKAVMSDLEGAFGEFKSTFQRLPEEVKVKIGCEIVGSVGTSGLITYFTAGGGSPLLAKSIAQAVTKVGNLIPGNSAIRTKTLKLAEQMNKKAASRTKIAAHLKQSQAELTEYNKQFDKFVDDLGKFYAQGKITDDMDIKAALPQIKFPDDLVTKFDPTNPFIFDDMSSYLMSIQKTDPELYKTVSKFIDIRGMYVQKRNLKLVYDDAVAWRKKWLQDNKPGSPVAASGAAIASTCTAAASIGNQVRRSGTATSGASSKSPGIR